MKIVCYGDSNTYGWDPAYFSGNHYAHPWPELTAEITGYEVINRGEPGRMIPYRQEALEWYRRDILTHTGLPADSSDHIPTDISPEVPGLLVIMLGTNDLLNAPVTMSAPDGGFRIPDSAADRIANNMDAMVRYSLQNHMADKILLLSCPRVTFQQDLYMPLLEKLSAQYRAIAKRSQIAFADPLCWDIPMAFDGVHFSEAGHRLFAQFLVTEIKNITEDIQV